MLMLYCVVLCCAVLCCAVLVLCCVVLCCIVLCCAVLYCIMLRSVVLGCVLSLLCRVVIRGKSPVSSGLGNAEMKAISSTENPRRSIKCFLYH